MQFPLALDDEGWKKAGVAPGGPHARPNGGRLKEGVVSHLVLGAFDIPHVPGVAGAPVEEYEKGLDVNLDGLVGAGFLAAFRVTIGDGVERSGSKTTSLPDALEAPRGQDGGRGAPPPHAGPPARAAPPAAER